MEKIKMKTPLVEMDGDEMTRVLWKWIKEILVEPFVELKTEYYDLGLKERDKTDDKVTVDSANATLQYGVAVKCATITPNAQRVEEYNLKNVYMAASAYDLINLAIDAFENVEDINNTDEILAYIKAHATRRCLSGDCKLLGNGFIANKAEWRTYKDGKPVFLGD